MLPSSASRRIPLGSSTVFVQWVLIRLLSVGGDGEEVGTGCAGRWGDHHFILTASHVLHSGAKPSDLRLFWRPSGAIERLADADLQHPKTSLTAFPFEIRMP
jgi:hypothetical protein